MWVQMAALLKHTIANSCAAAIVASCAFEPVASEGNLPLLEGLQVGAKPTVIRGEIVEAHDRILFDRLEKIVWRRTFTITLSGTNNVTEDWSNVRIDAGSEEIPSRDDYNDGFAQLGNPTQNMAWRVLGSNKLQRIVKHGRFVTLLTIDIDGKNKCHLERAYLFRKGDKIAPGENGGPDGAKYTPFRILSTHCTIE
jgi:hypothetical protein